MQSFTSCVIHKLLKSVKLPHVIIDKSPHFLLIKNIFCLPNFVITYYRDILHWLHHITAEKRMFYNDSTFSGSLNYLNKDKRKSQP